MKSASKPLVTIHDQEFEILEEDHQFKYQKELTKHFDLLDADFDQNTINEIVLWKVNRYARPKRELISIINTIKKSDEVIDVNKTKTILNGLLQTPGIQLAMASTILRFKNPFLYQIIDQRVYRILYEGKRLKLPDHSSEKNRADQIDLFIKYLYDLKLTCINFKISFEKADRILYMADKRVNKNHKLINY